MHGVALMSYVAESESEDTTRLGSTSHGKQISDVFFFFKMPPVHGLAQRPLGA